MTLGTLLRSLLLLTLFSYAALEASGQETAQNIENTSERIISFHVDLRIDSSGMMHVSEKIKVYASGEEIRRGLVRTIPTERKDIFGERKQIDFKITSILKNGVKENYKIKGSGHSRTIYIGKEDIILNPGVYSYEINYDTRGHVGFFKDYDEIYWNVTGSQWDFPIETASATVYLPKGAIPGNSACYTGVPGSKAKNCDINRADDQTVTFKATTSLYPGQGFTIAQAFTPGIIQRPSAFDTFLNDYLKVALTAILLIILGVYYYISWSRYGRDPVQQVVVPTFNIPNDWSPALLRYFYKKKIDDKSFAISIINMAVQKVIKITRGIGKKEDYAVEKSTESSSGLANEEQAIYARLLNNKKKIYINKANGSTINSAKNAHSNRLKPQLNFKDFFLNVKQHILKSLAVTSGALLIFMVFVDSGTPLLILFFSPFIALGGFCFFKGLQTFKESAGVGIFLIIWGAGFGGAPLFAFLIGISKFPPLSLVFLLGTTFMFLTYMYLIKAPTEAGSAILTKIKGFKMYLETAEEHRLNLLNPPEQTPELFEKFLPYALALDVENAWGAKFERILTEANYMPDWYDGDPFAYNKIARGFILPFNAAVSDSKPESHSDSSSSGSSSWDSGSSGSGSSDSGGGGGGGGGW
jgi:uncharacterized membrane protein YgcG